MATCNFPLVNTSKYFVFGEKRYITQEDIDENDWPQEYLGQFDEIGTQDDFECALANAKYDMKEIGYFRPNNNEAFMEKEYYFSFCGMDFRITIKVQACNGYYEAACWDYEAELENLSANYLNGYSLTDDADEINAQIMLDDGWSKNKGFLQMQEENINKRIEKEFASLVEEIEKVFDRWSSSKMRRVGVFSNGSAIYEYA